jgi:hypothetical protein
MLGALLQNSAQHRVCFHIVYNVNGDGWHNGGLLRSVSAEIVVFTFESYPRHAVI